MKLDMIFESNQILNQGFVFRLHFLLNKLFLTIVLIIFLASSNSISQTRNSEFAGFAINPKIGFYKASMDKGGFTYGAEVNYFKNKFLISADYYRIDEFVLFKSPAEQYNHTGIMFGSFSDKGKFRFQYQAGFGLLWGTTRTDVTIDDPYEYFGTIYESEDFFAVGFTPKLGIKFIQFYNSSIGIDLQANINMEKSVFMPFLSFEIGRLRNKKNVSKQ